MQYGVDELMNSYECLAKLPGHIKDTVTSYWKQYGSPNDETSTEDLMNDKKTVQHVYAQLFGLERKVLNLILGTVGYSPFSQEQLEQHAAGRMSGAECKVALIRLQQKGIVFTFSKAWGEHIYIIPVDSFPLWTAAAFTPFNREVKNPDITEQLFHQHPGLTYDVLQLLSYGTLYELSLTQKGTLLKRHLQKLQASFMLKDAHLSGLALHYAHQETYPPAFAVIADLAFRLGLLMYETEALSINRTMLEQWLKLTVSEADRLILISFLETHVPQNIMVQHLWMNLWNVPKGEWISIQDYVSWLKQQDFMNEGMLEPADAEKWLQPLSALGWIEIGKTGDQFTFFRVSSNLSDPHSDQRQHLDEPFEPMYVQPDYEVLVPPHVPLWMHWELLLISELLSRDQVSRYRLTKESIHRACEKGRSESSILDFLKRHSLMLPEHVEWSIKDWCSQFGQMTIQDVTLLRCKDRSVAELLKTQEQFRDSILEAISEVDFIIKAEHLEAFEKWLAKRSMTPVTQRKEERPKSYLQVNVDQQLTHSTRFTSDRQVKGLIYSKGAVHYYHSPDTLPDIADIYPSMDRIPALWLQSFRPYHHSVRKEMVEHALAYKALLKLNRNGKAVTFAPTQLSEQPDGWVVKGIEERRAVTLSPQEWQEMQLILPGINDNNEE